uniref:E2F-associated phosphoprotein n=1 Tax=Strongyloides papillosus TaxID=174720 RepID=A0A0N5BV29_STREA
MSGENPLIDDIKSIAKTSAESDFDFYCALEDDLNQKWVDDKLRKQKGLNSEEANEGENKDLDGLNGEYTDCDFKTDAVLSCPSCLTVVCYECQRHESYKNQYRAMFAQSVKVDFDKKLYIPVNSKMHSTELVSVIPENAKTDDIFYPVYCAHCKHRIGVYDNEEVYHFFEVITGYS